MRKSEMIEPESRNETFMLHVPIKSPQRPNKYSHIVGKLSKTNEQQFVSCKNHRLISFKKDPNSTQKYMLENLY